MTVEAILAVMAKNVGNARRLVAATTPLVARKPGCSCGSALATAILTAKDRIPAEARERLGLLIGKYLPG